MQRQPSLHIKEADLVKVLKEVFGIKEDKWGYKYDELAKEICIRGRKYQSSNRKILATNDKDRKRTRILVKSSSEDAYLFCQLLLASRKRLKRRGINIIKEGSREWVTIKEATKLAVDSCNDFALDKRTGFTNYIEIGLSKMHKFSINKFNGLHQSITEHFESLHQAIKDPSPDKTREVHLYYQKRVNEKIGINEDYTNIPDKYIYFIQTVEQCKKYKVDHKTYIDAQFEGLLWANAIPEPNQLVGGKSGERLRAYLSKNNIQPKKRGKIIDFSSLREKK